MQSEKNKATESIDATLSKEATVPTLQGIGMLEKGTNVTINKTILEGTIAGYHISTDNTTLSYLVDYTDEGEQHQRAFTPNQITKK